MFDLSQRALRLSPLLVLGALLAAPAPGEAQTWRTMTSARQIAADRSPLAVHLQYGAGELRVGPAADRMLYQMDLRYDEEAFAPVAEFDQAKRALRLGVSSREGRRRGINVREGSRAEIGLAKGVPLDLQLEFGAGKAELDLGGLSLQRLSLSTGASETRVHFGAANPIAAERVSIEAGAADLQVTGLGNVRAERIAFQGGVGSTVLDFRGRWSRDATASVQMGLGSVVLRFPRGLGVRVNRSSFLASFNPEGLTREGNSYYSADWASATHRLTVDVSAAFGSIQVEWVDN
jgi:hypothetical protein